MSLLYSCETGERIFEVAFTFKVSVTGAVVGSVGLVVGTVGFVVGTVGFVVGTVGLVVGTVGFVVTGTVVGVVCGSKTVFTA